MSSRQRFAIVGSSVLCASISLASGCDGSAQITSKAAEGSQQALQSTDVPESKLAVPYVYPSMERDPGLANVWLDVSSGRGEQDSVVALEESILGNEEGPSSSKSGLVRYGRRLLSQEEQAARASKKTAKASLRTPAKLDASLARRMQELDDRARIPVTVVMVCDESVPLFVQLEDLVVAGAVQTKADLELERADLRNRRSRLFGSVRAPMVSHLKAQGVSDILEYEHLPMLSVSLTKAQIDALAKDERVRRISWETPLLDEHGGTIVRGAHQVQQFIDVGADGGGANVAGIGGWDMTFAQVEGAGANDEHPGYRENTSTTDYRIRGRFNCSGSTCTSTSNFTTEGYHASAMAGIIFGDLRQGQDPAITNAAQRADRTGMSPEARGWMISSFGIAAYNTIIGLTGAQVHVVNQSSGTNSGECDGDTAMDRTANLMFEDGSLMIKSAGNDGHAGSGCTTTVPASAIGVFTVGGVGNSETETSVATLKAAAPYDASSRGGAHNRSIVSIAASACRELMFDTVDGYSTAECGTSISAATTSGTALNFIDWYKITYSNYIDNPGVLFTNLLLMGNRRNQFGSSLVSGYDNLLGAGHLRARRFDADGLDGPYGWATGSVCVGQGETVTVDIAGGVLSTDVDTVVVTAYWYDARHGTTGELDDIDLYLEKNGGLTMGSSTSLDNKERVFHNAPGGSDLSFDLYGYSVTADSAGCGTNRMRVYYAYYYEDSDREAAENLAGIDPA